MKLLLKNLKVVVLLIVLSGFLLSTNDALAFEPLFDARVNYDARGETVSICTADLDGDGDNDLGSS